MNNMKGVKESGTALFISVLQRRTPFAYDVRDDGAVSCFFTSSASHICFKKN